ncbi:DUF1566 domain-containing protein [Thiothrix caldifontis]|nr:DUF1566 domain-containing protein [Thiothrix caldifontis]
MTMKRFSLLLSGSLLFTSANVVMARQDCNQNIPSSTPVQRFNDQGNGTLIDVSTGLMWKKCLEGQTGERCVGRAVRMEWDKAVSLAQLSNSDKFAGYSGWRLPTLDELGTLVDKRCIEPAVNNDLFPNMLAVGLWSVNQSDPLAWSMDFGKGRAYEHFKGAGKYIRLVRNLR